MDNKIDPFADDCEVSAATNTDLIDRLSQVASDRAGPSTVTELEVAAIAAELKKRFSDLEAALDDARCELIEANDRY